MKREIPVSDSKPTAAYECVYYIIIIKIIILLFIYENIIYIFKENRILSIGRNYF